MVALPERIWPGWLSEYGMETWLDRSLPEGLSEKDLEKYVEGLDAKDSYSTKTLLMKLRICLEAEFKYSIPIDYGASIVEKATERECRPRIYGPGGPREVPRGANYIPW